MTNDQAIAWAWADVRKEVGTENWTTGDSSNFYGFFLHGWNYRGQYELQRNVTKAAVMREIADTCDYELQQAPAHPAKGVPAQEAEAKIGELLALARIMVRAALDADNKTQVQEIKAAIESEVAFERALRAALAATQPAAQGLDAQALSEWLLARRSHLGSSRESAANWCERWGAKSWDNYTLLSKHFAVQAKKGSA